MGELEADHRCRARSAEFFRTDDAGDRETNMVDRFVLVTSGNKGLGFETARRLKALGYIVYMGRALVPRVKGRLRRSESRGFSLTSLTKALPAVPPPRWTRARGGSISSSTMLACAATAAVEAAHRSPFLI
jgi:NAD(P)-dependent dehydrogenase (short-subunit alcohol dehydrogenase family)